jgi:hypothetical protein
VHVSAHLCMSQSVYQWRPVYLSKLFYLRFHERLEENDEQNLKNFKADIIVLCRFYLVTQKAFLMAHELKIMGECRNSML